MLVMVTCKRMTGGDRETWGRDRLVKDASVDQIRTCSKRAMIGQIFLNRKSA